MFPELSAVQLIMGMAAAFLVGVAKTAMPGLAMTIVPLMAMIFPPKASVGILLLLLLTGDIFAVAYYRKFAARRQIVKLVPWVGAGIGLGALILSGLNNHTLKPVLGAIVFVMLSVEFTRRLRPGIRLRGNPLLTGLVGLLAGCATTLGNAAGPIMSVYFIMMGFDKRQFMGTAAWFFLAVNLGKVPIYIHLDMIRADNFRFWLWMAPIVVLGALTGKKVFRLLPQIIFDGLILALAAAGASWLLFG
jgi:uncharacterized membrane protein YfcA